MQREKLHFIFIAPSEVSNDSLDEKSVHISGIESRTYCHYSDQLVRLSSVNLRTFQHLQPSDQVLTEASMLELSFLLQAGNLAYS